MLGGLYSLEKGEFAEFIRFLLNYGDIANFLSSEFSLIKSANGIFSEEMKPKQSLFSPKMIFNKPVKESNEDSEGPYVLFGLKPCDLASLNVLDAIYIGRKPTDQKYAKLRDESLIVSCDCNDFCEDCFISGFASHSSYQFDLNLSFFEDIILVQSGSEKGSEIIEALSLEKADHESEQRLLRKREHFKAKIKEQSIDFGVAYNGQSIESIKEMLNEYSLSCVSCGACDYICPVNNRFNIDAEGDSAQITWTTYPEDGMTVAERFVHKNIHFKGIYGCSNCVGCARCTTACPGGINIAEIHRKLTAFAERFSNEKQSV